MGHWVERVWEGASFGARRDRQAFRYQAYVPDPVADWDPSLPAALVRAVTDATEAVRLLNESGTGIDLEVLAAPLLRAESLGSSFIEGLRASNKRVAMAAYEPVAADATARSVLGNVRAMERAVELGTSSRPFTVGELLDIHRSLLEQTSEARFAGLIRQEQNWVGGRSTSPAGAAFVPPPPEEVPRLLDDLVAFCNRDDLPVLVQAAVAHAQFETIHPFGDGNGRAGRCLVHVVLRRRGLAPRLVPPVSVVLAANARRYIAGLTDYREDRIDDWCGVFAHAVERASHEAEGLAERITELLDNLLARAGSPRKDAVARRIVLGLPAHPIVSADTAAERYGVTPTAARTALGMLESRGVLSLARVGRRRDREWVSNEVFELLDSFEHDLGVPTDDG